MGESLAHSYRTLRARSEGQFTEKRSKFISFAVPVESEEEALERVEEFRREYYDARHVCWAYRIGKHDPIERVNDDGEPSSTAGRPILGQILSNELTDLLVVVIRYFGGVKLGTGGLIVAYRTAAAEAIENGEIVEHTLYTKYSLRFPFDEINQVMMYLRQHDAITLDNDADLEGHIWYVKVANAGREAFVEGLERLYFVKAEILPDEPDGSD